MSSKPSHIEIASDERSLVDYLEPNLTYLIGGQPLQEIIRNVTSDDSMLGLVSPWFGCLHSEREQAIVDEKLDPRTAGSCRVPVLVCSDDLDLTCTVVIADVFVGDEFVCWRQLGIDSTPSSNPEHIGRAVDRIADIGEFRFKRDQYEDCVDAFLQYRTKLTEQGGAGPWTLSKIN